MTWVPTWVPSNPIQRRMTEADTREVVLRKLAVAAQQNCNLLLNTGPLPGGSIHPGDAATLRAVGKHFRH